MGLRLFTAQLLLRKSKKSHHLFCKKKKKNWKVYTKGVFTLGMNTRVWFWTCLLVGLILAGLLPRFWKRASNHGKFIKRYTLGSSILFFFGVMTPQLSVTTHSTPSWNLKQEVASVRASTSDVKRTADHCFQEDQGSVLWPAPGFWNQRSHFTKFTKKKKKTQVWKQPKS